jgi:hypothetical protein
MYFCRKLFREGTYPVCPGLGGLSFVTFLCPQKKSKNPYGKAF